jgi:hypothetical protein
MAVQAVRVVSVPVSDQDRAEELYEDKLREPAQRVSFGV